MTTRAVVSRVQLTAQSRQFSSSAAALAGRANGLAAVGLLMQPSMYVFFSSLLDRDMVHITRLSSAKN